MKIEFSFKRREMLLFLTTNVAVVTSRANQQLEEPIVILATIGLQGEVSKGEGKVGKMDSGQELGLGFIINKSSELVYGYMTCGLRLFVDYPPERPLTRLRLTINLIPLSALNFDFLH